MPHSENNSVAVTQATESELDDVVPLFDRYRQFYKQPQDLLGCRAFLAARFRENDSVILVARMSGKAIGFTQLYPSYSSVAMCRIWILNDLYVAPDARRYGAGKALLDHAEQMARATGAVRLVLTTAKDNSTAQELYEQCGWEKEEVFMQYQRTL